jgi:arylsulfatase A-like enzyme/tetratricopeptide (TPR) repeat protein
MSVAASTWYRKHDVTGSVALAALVIAAVVACGPSREGEGGTESARVAFLEALEREDRAAAIAAVDALRESLPATADSSLEVAGLLVRAGEAPQASWVLEEGVRRFPERDDLRIALSRVATQVGSPSMALEVLAPIGAESGQHGAALVARAQAHLHLGNLDQALATLSEAERAYPNEPAARLMRVAVLMSENRTDEASEAIVQARKTLGSDLESVRRRLNLTLALIQSARDDPEPAIATLEAMLQLGPDYTLVWRVLIQVLKQHGRSAEAIERLEAELERADPPPELHWVAAHAYASVGRDHRAEESLRSYASQSHSAGAYLPWILFHSEREQLKDTLSVLVEAVARFPEDPTLRRIYCEASLAAGEVTEARRELAVFRRLAYPDDPRIEYLAARIALASGDARGAADRLRQLAPRLDEPATHFWLAKALEAQDDIEGARRRYALALARDASWSPPHAALLELARRRGDWGAASRHVRRLLDLSPWRHDLPVLLVEALIGNGRSDLAERFARERLDDFPEHPELRLSLAQALRAQGRYAEALSELDATAAEGAGPDLVAERALTLGMAGEIGEGIALLRREVLARPDEARLHAVLAKLFFGSGAAAEGDQATDTALGLDPDDPQPLRVRCEYRAAGNQLAGAKRDCSAYLAARRQDAGAHFLLGAVLAKLGEREQAIASYQRSAQLDSQDWRSRNNLAELLAATGDLDGALAAAQEAYRLDPGSAHVLHTLGTLYLRKGLSERAVSLLEDARAADAARFASTHDLALADGEVGSAGNAPKVLPRRDRDASDARLRDQIGGSVASLSKPNIVLVVVDTLRADETTPYGSALGTSPELQAWAANGVVFERTRSQSSWTKISMASLMTSLWPRSHGIRAARDGLSDGAVTLAEILRKTGYATYAVQTNGWLHQSFGFHQGFDRYVFPRGASKRLQRASVWPHADRVLEEAKRVVAAHDPDRPFFLYLHFMDVHEYAAPPEFQIFGADDRGAYRAAIRWVDDALRRVREMLEEQNHLGDTVLVFASDHGEGFGEHGVHGHARNVLTPVVSVPLVIRFPFTVAPRRIRTQVRNLDIAPTLLELAGAPIPEHFEGASLISLLTEAGPVEDRASFAALGQPLFVNASVQASATDGTWTYAQDRQWLEAGERKAADGDASGQPTAEHLFDRAVDPGENVNLISREPEQADRMRALLRDHLAAAGTGIVEADVWIDPAIADRLRAMGYLR